MPVDYKRYPPNWKTEIRPRILARAQNRCERCGAENYQPHPLTGSRVVLTIAHIDNDTAHNDDSNLLALCQKCHNSMDVEFRRPHAKKTRLNNKTARIKAAGQLSWLEE